LALRLTSLLLIALALPSAGRGQAFGRFGYTESLAVPGFSIGRDGFAAAFGLSDRFTFTKASQTWKPLATSATEQTVGLDEWAGNPSKVRANLLSPGFGLFFPTGIVLHLTSTSAPYLSWREGSVSSGVPTPNVTWAVLSFRDAQPPVIFGFPDGPASLEISGKPGAWVVKGPPTFRGWVRVGLPTGLQAQAANSAASLGRLAKAAAAEEDLWSQSPPILRSVDTESDEDGVVATWTFDRPGALVPRAASLAPLGGYPLKVLSATRKLPFSIEKGPLEATTEPVLKIRLPVRRMPYGRGLSVGADLSTPIGTVSPLDIPSVVELALETLTSTRDTQSRKSAEQAVTEYLSLTTYAKEPWTGQLLPYAADGAGIDLAGAQALLMQAVSSASRPSSEANSLLTSVEWRCDWDTWLPWVDDPTRRRRGAALAALAGAMCPEPERRLTAGMFQAGLSAEKGLQVWLRRRGEIPKEGQLLEPMLGLRQGLFRLQSANPEPDAAFAECLLSPVRIYGDVPVRLFRQDKDLIIEWPVLEPKPSILHFIAAYELQFEPQANLPRFKADQLLGSTDVAYTPETTGTCRVKLTCPPWAKPLPASAPTPHYSEPQR
jgi:hypothetical protein